MKPPSPITLKKPLTEKQRAHLERLHGTDAGKAALKAGREKYHQRVKEERAVRVASGLFRCAKCTIEKAATEYPTSRKNRHGEPRFRYCKPCHNDYQRVNRLRLFYSISIEDYDRMLAAQGGTCAICEKPPATIRLAVDHNHKTGLIRGLLCAWCNRAIGQFRDDLERVKRVMAYFSSPPGTSALGGERYGIKGRVTNKVATRKRLARSAA